MLTSWLDREQNILSSCSGEIQNDLREKAVRMNEKWRIGRNVIKNCIGW